MIVISFKEAIKEVKKIRKINISIEDLWDKILNKEISTKMVKGELKVSYNDVLFYFNPDIFTIVTAKEKRKKFVEQNYKALWDREMIGTFESEEDDFEGLYSYSSPNYESDLWTMRSKNIYLNKEEEAYNER
jgi:hypothetical protein